MLDAGERQHKVGVIGRIEGYHTDLFALNDEQQLLRTLGTVVLVYKLDARRTGATITRLFGAEKAEVRAIAVIVAAGIVRCWWLPTRLPDFDVARNEFSVEKLPRPCVRRAQVQRVDVPCTPVRPVESLIEIRDSERVVEAVTYDLTPIATIVIHHLDELVPAGKILRAFKGRLA